LYLGIFDTGKEAAIAYDLAVHKYGLPVSMLNFPTMQHADEVDGVDDLDRRNTARKCFMPTSMKKQQTILSKYMYDSTTTTKHVLLGKVYL
jgi:hypothetical protein